MQLIEDDDMQIESYQTRPVLPGLSWADLAEDDPEMQLMGPPTHCPLNVDPEWCMPRRTRKPIGPTPITPFLQNNNQFATLQHLLAADEDAAAMRQLPPTVASAVRQVWADAPEPPERGSYQSCEGSEPDEQSTLEPPQTPPPTVRTHSARLASSP